MSTNEAWFTRAERVMPGGVSSPVRAYRAVGGTPRVFTSGEGAHLVDVDGARVVDLQMAFGPLILGHAHPDVVAAVQAAARSGLAFGAPNPDEIMLAERAVAAHPALDWVRFVNSGTEAVMSATRLARASTGRDLVLKFDGCYHGHADAFLANAGSGLATFGIAASAGVPERTVADTATLPLDDEAALESFFHTHGHKVAAAIVEGVPANNGLLPQRKAWHQKLRRLTRAHGALLIVDEVITGFRMAWGGATQALGLEPDLVTLGKVLGGGMPVGAYGGRRDLMALVAPLGPVYQAGTLSGNPVAMGAGLATLAALDAYGRAHDTLAQRTTTLARRIQESANDAGLPMHVRTEASMLWAVPQEDAPPRTSTPLSKATVDRFARLHAALLSEGVFMPPSAYEMCFVSLAHGETILEETADAFARALRRISR